MYPLMIFTPDIAIAIFCDDHNGPATSSTVCIKLPGWVTTTQQNWLFYQTFYIEGGPAPPKVIHMQQFKSNQQYTISTRINGTVMAN